VLRWLYHVRVVPKERAWPYAPPSLTSEGFIHASYRDAVVESAALYLPREASAEVLVIDPRRLAARVDVAATPRGPMPHIVGPIPESAVAQIFSLSQFGSCLRADRVTPATDALEAARARRDAAPRDREWLHLLRDALVACAAECEARGDAAEGVMYLGEAGRVISG
jgi:uncharacterized protein (DUF952 family)